MSTIVTDDYYAQETPIASAPLPPPPADSLDSPPLSPTSHTEDRQAAPANEETVKDVVLWRKKRVSAAIAAAATATWVVLQIYQFSFLTLAAWFSMAIVFALFLWGNLTRLVGRQSPKMPDLEISERTAIDAAYSVKGLIEHTVRRMLELGVHGQLYECAAILGALWVLSWIGSRVELLTFMYTAVMVGLTAPAIYDKYDDKIRACWQLMRQRAEQGYNIFNEKVVMKLKQTVGTTAANARKEKKSE